MPDQAPQGRRRRVQRAPRRGLRGRLLLARLPGTRDVAQTERRVLAREDRCQCGARQRHGRAFAHRRLEGHPHLGTRGAQDREDEIRGIVGREQGYKADALLWAHLDALDCSWAILTGWEGSGECIVVRERAYVRVTEAS